MLWIPEQDQLLRAAYPQFATQEISRTRGVWVGELTPRNRSYRIRIEYELPDHLVLRGIDTYEFYPRVYVLSPELERHADFELGPIPHVWWDKTFHDQPNLCLFRPIKNEWNWSDAIADTTVPDAADWLFFYELWLVTQRWMGGGERHQPSSETRKNGRAEKVRRDALRSTSKTALAEG